MYFNIILLTLLVSIVYYIKLNIFLYEITFSNVVFKFHLYS